ncbi:uncharacterized protein LOC126719182 [Quercus robur]|uniref:uncharacterized protein LOC126719182 n=1 Tax=Quercus robur TaxID=38942 RepID=UPI002161FDC5|nr:uncharacterized protein LOC126719182 [Quercus robur]
MEAEYALTQRSSEEEDELHRSVKKFKDSHGSRSLSQPRLPVSYKDTLVGDIPGAYQQAFQVDKIWEDSYDSDSELEPLVEGMAEVTLSKETKARIRAPWVKALIVKVYGKSVGFNYLTFKINALWKPIARMDCVNLGKDYFLIRFSNDEDYDKVLHGGPWFVGGHFLAIKPWEPYFKASEDKLTSVAVWVRFPELPIEFYDISVLKEIGSVIGPVLRIDSYTASETRGSYVRLCIQVNLDKPLIKSIRIGRLVQQVLYEGISTLCFCCGRLGHKQENCCYRIKPVTRDGEEPTSPKPVNHSDNAQSEMNYGPWMVVSRKRSPVKSEEGMGLLKLVLLQVMI